MGKTSAAGGLDEIARAYVSVGPAGGGKWAVYLAEAPERQTEATPTEVLPVFTDVDRRACEERAMRLRAILVRMLQRGIDTAAARE